jgi:two-component system chemotaxis response regulator CheY
LVVDDSPVMRIMLQEMLIGLGHQVVAEACDGAEALRMYRANKPDLVTLDISLPDMDGLAVLQNLRRADPNAKVMIVTGNDQKAIETKALAMKALGVLHKPFDSNELSSIIEKARPHIQRPGA